MKSSKDFGKERNIIQNHFFPNNQEAKREPPKNEMKGKAVPERGEKPNDEKIPDRDLVSALAASQRDIEIITKPQSQCDMPFAVKRGHRGGGIGMIEVLNKRKSQHNGNAGSH